MHACPHLWASVKFIEMNVMPSMHSETLARERAKLREHAGCGKRHSGNIGIQLNILMKAGAEPEM